MPTESIREKLEKIAWKHYDPEASINVEEMLDEMMPVVESAYQSGRDSMKEEVMKAIPDERAGDCSCTMDEGCGCELAGFNECRSQLLLIIKEL